MQLDYNLSMKYEINVGQIFLTHPRDDNFTSVYEETILKQKEPAHLFAIIEIGDVGVIDAKARDEYQKLARIIVSTLKRAYLNAVEANEDTFERALGAINAALSRQASKDQVAALPRLGSVIGVVAGNTLNFSVTGNALVYLKRREDFTFLSEGLAAETLKPTKLFANYSSGRIAAWDRIMFSNRAPLNFLSLERLQEFLSAETLEDVCAEVIESLSDIKNSGFAAYIFEVASQDKSAPAQKSRILPSLLQLPKQPLARSDWQKYLAAAWDAIMIVGAHLWRGAVSLFTFALNLISGHALASHGRRARSKKLIISATAVLLVIFLGTLAFSSWRKNRAASEQTAQETTNNLEQRIAEAESALLYNNQNGALALVPEIETLIADLPENAEGRAGFIERLVDLKNQVNKELRVDNPTVLAAFESVPTTLIHSPNGFLAFNKNTGRLAFYDFRTAEARKIFQNQNTGNLAFGEYLGPAQGYVFLDKNGKWLRMNLESETLGEISATAAAAVPTPSDLGHSRAIALLGTDASARLYLLDQKNNQIWRLDVNEDSIVAPAAWLKTSANLAEAIGLGADSAIYTLFSDGLQKYTSGTRQNFSLPPIQPALQNLSGMFVSADTTYIYLLDPDNSRVVVLTKQGQLERQIISPKFRDLSDIYVDEAAGLMYAIAGSELLQINLK